MNFKFKINSFGGDQLKVILSNIVSLGILQIINYILPILVMPFLVYTIGMGNVGVIAIATAFCAYFQVFMDYGFSLTATKEIAKNKDDANIVSSIASAVINIKIILFLIFLFLFFLIVYFVPSYHEHIDIFLFTYMLCFFQSLFPQWYFQAMEKMMYTTIMNSIPKILAVILLFFAIHGPGDTWKVQFVFFIGNVVSVIWAMFVLKLKFKFSYSLNITMIKEQFIAGWSIFLARFFSTLYKNSNVIILGTQCNPTLVGSYAVAEKIIRSAQSVQNVIGDSLFPWFVKRSGKNERFFKTIHERYKWIIIFIYLFSAAFVALFSDLIARILVHNNWQLVGYQIKIMSLVFFFGGLNYFYGILGLVAHNFNRLFSSGVMITGLFNVVVCYFLVEIYSVSGASVTMVLSEALLLLLIVSFISKSGIAK